MLEINHLQAKIAEKEILKGLNLTVKPGEVHVIMGPNGSGKSTLANILAGREGYQVSGSVTFFQQDLLTLLPEERSGLGLFLSFQYPIEIPGVTNLVFLKTALNALRKRQQKPALDSLECLNIIKTHCQCLDLEENFLYRPLNAGLSGGEKKRNEILQMLVLEPKLVILDEPDSGLDVDALKVVGRGINLFRKPDNAIVLITHYRHLLNLVRPDFVHILKQGKIVKTAGIELVEQIERTGYQFEVDER